MTSSPSLRSLIAKPFLDRAGHAALRGRFGEAEQHLASARRLDPDGHQASLFTAKLRLREGRLEDCRQSLLEARRLGHDAGESDQMLAWLEVHGRNRTSETSVNPADARAAGVHVPREAPGLNRFGTSKDNLQTISWLRTYLERHPACPSGLARLAEALASKSLAFGGSRPMLDEAESEACRATSIMTTSSEAQAALGFVLGVKGAAEDAEQRWRLAIELDASNWFALHCLGSSLVRRTLYEQAAVLLARSVEAQPLFIPSYDPLHRAFRGLAAEESAAQVLQEGIARAWERIATVPEDLVAHLHLAILLARKGLRTESRKVAANLSERHAKSGLAHAHLAIAHAANGDLEDALASLVAARGRSYDIRSMTDGPDFDPIRSSKDFLRLKGSFTDS